MFKPNTKTVYVVENSQTGQVVSEHLTFEEARSSSVYRGIGFIVESYQVVNA